MRERWPVGQVTADEWRHRAEREAAAILAEAAVGRSQSYEDVLSLVAVGWLQGVSLGQHETLQEVNRAFERIREEL